MWKNIERIIFYSVIILVSFILLCVGNYLPMIDLPQHAAQVSTFNDLVKGQSLWGGFVEYNWFTPYLTCYGLWFLIYQFFDIVTASRIIITISFLLYIYSFILLRKSYHAEKILDWVCIPSFFGFAYYYGFVTFLMSIPIGIFYFIIFRKFIENKINKYNFYFIVLGFVLFFSHVLSFLFFTLLSFAHLIEKERGKFYKYLIPFFIFIIPLAFYLLKGDELDTQYTYGENKWGTIFPQRVLELFLNVWNLNSPVFYIYMFCTLILLIIPFAMGYKLSKNSERYVPVVILLICWFSLPLLYNNIYFIYNRFTLVFFGFYYLIFVKKNENENFSKNFLIFSSSLFYLILFYLVLKVFLNIIYFSKENENFSKFINEIPEGKTAISLPLLNSSLVIESIYTYVHFPLWYQAERKGWVDYNFAWASPQIVRFKKDKTPEVGPGFEWDVGRFTQLKNCNYYDYLIIRGDNYPLILKFIKDSNCNNYKISHGYGNWYAFKRID